MRLSPGRPNFYPLVTIKDLTTALSEFVGLDKVSAGVGVYGEAAAYALVWELGSRRLKSPGPKTLWSMNRNQEEAILTKQAPFGYVTPVDGFYQIMQEEIGDCNFTRAHTPKEMVALLEIAMDNAAHRIAKIIASRAPKDSGTLSSQILGIDADEQDFLDLSADAESEAGGTLIL